MKLGGTTIAVLLGATLALAYGSVPDAFASESPSDVDAAFDRLKRLVGTWDVEGSERRVEYSLTGGGETVVEEFQGDPMMATFYHRDGNDILLTHYCNAGNQPRMKADAYDLERGVLSFGFLDITNLASPEAYHTRELEVRFHSEDRVELVFVGRNDGKEVESSLYLHRRSH